MKRVYIFFIALYIASGSVAKLPVTIFSIGAATVEETTFDEARDLFGNAKDYELKEGAATNDRLICYFYSKNGEKAFLVFFTSDMGGETHTILGFRLTLINPRIEHQQVECYPTQINLFSLETSNGIKLGQSVNEFKTNTPVPFKKKEGIFVYEQVKKIHPDWPKFDDEFWYEYSTIKAQFKNDKLINLEASQITSN